MKNILKLALVSTLFVSSFSVFAYSYDMTLESTVSSAVGSAQASVAVGVVVIEIASPTVVASAGATFGVAASGASLQGTSVATFEPASIAVQVVPAEWNAVKDAAVDFLSGNVMNESLAGFLADLKTQNSLLNQVVDRDIVSSLLKAEI